MLNQTGPLFRDATTCPDLDPGKLTPGLKEF
jgi:hypothetical protein